MWAHLCWLQGGGSPFIPLQNLPGLLISGPPLNIASPAGSHQESRQVELGFCAPVRGWCGGPVPRPSHPITAHCAVTGNRTLGLGASRTHCPELLLAGRMPMQLRSGLQLQPGPAGARATRGAVVEPTSVRDPVRRPMIRPWGAGGHPGEGPRGSLRGGLHEGLVQAMVPPCSSVLCKKSWLPLETFLCFLQTGGADE